MIRYMQRGAERGRFQMKLSSSFQEFLSKDNFCKLEMIMCLDRVQEGNYLFGEGEEAKKLYYIRSGRVKLKKSTEEGKDFILSIKNKGDLVGEYGGSGDTYHSFSAEVMEDVEIGIIQIKDLENLMYQFGYFAIQFIKWLGLMDRIAQSKFRDLLLYGKSGALASTLIRISNTYGVLCPEGIMLDIKLTNTEIGDFIGTTRESVNRLLNSWKEEGTIEISEGKIIIKRLQDLRSICNCPTNSICPKEICRM